MSSACSLLSLLPHTPLKTVHEVDSSPSPSPCPGWHDSPTLLRDSPQHARHPTSRRSPKSPDALLHNDWYLNHLYDEVRGLYKPGTFTKKTEDSPSRLSDISYQADYEFSPATKSSVTVSHLSTCTLSRPPLIGRFTETLTVSMPPKRKAKGAAEGESKLKRTPARRDLLHDEKHVFSVKSKLVGEDLTSLFAHPVAWTTLSEEEKEEVRSLLPGDMIYDENGAPNPEFLRYDNDWRNSLRLFGEDVQAGRYEPGWLQEAHEAAECRRRGDFDQWKEEQFEEFWGQKSDAHADLMAGKAVNVRLPEMIKAGLFQVGDILAYTRSFKAVKGASGGFIVEKDPVIFEISGKTLSFTMAPGQLRKPASRPLPPVPSSDESPVVNGDRPSTPGSKVAKTARFSAPLSQPERSLSATSGRDRSSAPVSQRSASAESGIEADTNTGNGSKGRLARLFSIRRSVSRESDTPQQQQTSTTLDVRRKPIAKKSMEVIPNDEPVVEPVPPIPTIHQQGEDSDSPLSSIGDDDELESIKFSINSKSANSSPQKQSGALITVEGVDSLHTLEQKILEIDGRRKGEPRANAWRTFRCKRGNEDLGTLWEMREAFYKQRYG